MTIKILGGGCPKCRKLYENTKEALTLKGIDATVEKVTDMAEIMNYHVISTPALVVDEKVVSTGQVLRPADIAEFL